MDKQVVIEARKMATLWSSKMTGMDNTNKTEFDKFYSMVKLEETREEGYKAMLEASKDIKSDNQRRGYKSMMSMAIAYCEVNTVCNYKLVDWENLKSMVRLYKYVAKHHSEVARGLVKDKLSNVWTKGLGGYSYNNALTAKLDALKEEYKVETKVLVPTYTKVFNDVEKLNDNDKEAILLSLMEELGYEVGSVA